MSSTPTETGSGPVARSRREEILEVAVRMFATRGYHGVSMDDIGRAVDVTGPALYHHFKGKEAMLVAALRPVSQRLLSGGRKRVEANPDDPRAALHALVEFHVDFALTNPAVIALHVHELDRLPDESRHEIRKLQRQYVEEWVTVLVALRPELSEKQARVLAHAAFGLMNSTPYFTQRGQGGHTDHLDTARLLREATLGALAGTP
ncbi:TetR/AcrR family transcriptional regulator [Phytomonospora sp. NPDC050363]|uniref:TetR/AcrR family transcriptional regulator n=1 Tax=Phytomonospora sp. NPDC050363 TaxID=3155642 RepID=UPI0033C593F9